MSPMAILRREPGFYLGPPPYMWLPLLPCALKVEQAEQGRVRTLGQDASLDAPPSRAG